VVRSVIDFARPVAIMLSSVLHFIPGDGEAASIVEGYLSAAAPGSYLVLSHQASESTQPDEAAARGIFSRAVQTGHPALAGADHGLLRRHGARRARHRTPAALAPRPRRAGLEADVPLCFGYAGVGRKV
jgi:hypothetical protein